MGGGKTHALGLRTGSAVANSGKDQLAFELRKAAEHGEHQSAVGSHRPLPLLREEFAPRCRLGYAAQPAEGAGSK
jgi:hypothetical protein